VARAARCPKHRGIREASRTRLTGRGRETPRFTGGTQVRVLVHHSAGLCDQQCEREKHAEPRGLAAAGQEPGLWHTCKYSVGRELSSPRWVLRPPGGDPLTPWPHTQRPESWPTGSRGSLAAFRSSTPRSARAYCWSTTSTCRQPRRTECATPEWSRRPSGWRHGLLSEIETGLAGDSSCRENLLERLPIVRVPAGRQVLGLASGEAAMVKDDPGARAQIEQLEAH
jgi:hypothetical protein